MTDEFGKIIEEPTPDAAGENLSPYSVAVRYSKPTELRHQLRDYSGTYEGVRKTGLKPQSTWDLSEYIPQRPAGVFFFAANEQPHWGEIAVAVSDLDTSRLFAFPSAIAMLANDLQMYSGRIDEYQRLVAELWCAVAPVVSFSDYDGSFAAEWIYVGEVSPENLSWRLLEKRSK